MSNIIEKSRAHVLSVNGSELKALATNEGFQELFLQRQQILKKINDAKIEAIANITAQFAPELEEIDKQYSLMLTMIGDNSEDS